MKTLESIALSAVLALIPSVQSASFVGRPKGLDVRADGHPCAQLSQAVAAYGSAHPNATKATVSAELAYACAEVVPNKKQPALDFIDSLKPYLEFQSDVDSYLLNPPVGYLYPGVDLRAGLADIEDKVRNGSYTSELDFQTHLYALTLSARDGHLVVLGDVFQFFARGFASGAPPLVTVSADGISTPLVYSLFDLLDVNIDANTITPVTGFNPSPVKMIDGLDVVSWLLEESTTQRSQDPDANWNRLSNTLTTVALYGVNGQPGLYQQTAFYPGATTNVTFVNGTTMTYNNTFTTNIQSWTNITTNEDVYDQVVQTATATTASVSVSASASASASAQPAYPAPSGLPFFPAAVVTEGTNSYGGYYLTQDGLTDVAVLQITQFQPGSNAAAAEDFLNVIQDVMQEFFAAAVKSGKKKLIVDLQGNGGGFVYAGMETFAQLFPQIGPSTSSNFRAHLGSLLATQAAAFQINGTSEGDAYAEFRDSFDYQALLTTSGQPFRNYSDFYGPYTQGGGNFTNAFQGNYFNAEYSAPINFTGTNDRQNFTQPFDAENIILLYDGNCASTCTVFSELMKNQAGVQSIVIGGRPQTGPMQGVGAVKGSQVYESDDFSLIASLIDLGVQEKFGTVEGTIFENFDQGLALTRTNNLIHVNGHNLLRLGDASQTPLQYVYEAADCRIWYTPEMLYDATFLWNRVGEMAFKNRTNHQFSSPYCVEGSSGHPTSISGGWKNGTLGPQTPPKNAPFTLQGWPLDGTVIQNTVDETGSQATSKTNGALQLTPRSWICSGVFALLIWGLLG